MRYAFYSHGGCQNHGCEAIVNALSSMIKEKDNSSFIKLYTFDKSEDENADLPCVDEIEEFDYSKPKTELGIVEKAKLALYHKQSQKKADEYFYSLSCKNPSLKENDVYISVGGDNYCYGDGHVGAAINRELKALGKKTILWGCSFDEEKLSESKINDLKTYDLIVVRETLSFEILKKAGVDKNTVLYPDSAFTLAVDSSMEKTFPVKENTVGLNLSEMAVYHCKSEIKDLAKIACIKLVEHIVNDLDMNVLLIPHVTRDNYGDYYVLKDICETVKSSRVKLVGREYNALQYKSIISRCRMFVGARTHSTIAAYSTCVPTLVIGYSTKSNGIARDIFGTSDGYVIHVDDMNDENVLVEKFDEFMLIEEKSREVLKKVMPEYIAKARDAVNEISKII